MKIMGLATYAAHEWQDKAQSTKTVAIPTNVSMKLNYCKTEKLTDHSRRIPSEDVRDTESLIKVKLHRSTIICADHTTYPAVSENMTNYTDRDTRINSAYCKAYSGKMLRHNAILKPARHSVTWISVSRSKDEPRFFTFTDTFTEQGNIQASKKGYLISTRKYLVVANNAFIYLTRNS